MEIAKIILEILTEIGKLLLDAFQEDDPAKLRKVTDVLPAGHVLRSRAEYLHQKEVAEKAFGVNQ